MQSPPLRLIIVGAGFAGLGMAIRLRQEGIEEFVVLERSARLGGVWRDNSYPGVACDIESHLYSFSFAPNPDWSRTFAPGAEILAYLERCADSFGVRDKIRFNSGAASARWDQASGLWHVTTTDGVELRSRFLISGAGHALTQPIYPDIPGRQSFAGASFHSARWDHGYALEGRRVAVIGTGASAIQIVPAIAPRVGRLLLFQRTPPWVIPRRERDIPETTRVRLRRHPALVKLVRTSQYWRHEALGYGFVGNPGLLRAMGRLALRFLKASVPDPGLRARLTPSYTMGCKRILMSNDYYPALCRDNATVVTDAIVEIRPHSIVTRDAAGQQSEHAVDAIVWATGFEVAEARPPFTIRGRAGLDLDESWGGTERFYLGCTVAGFPNLFLLVGPNTGLGHNSMIFMMESQFAYILDALRTAEKRGLRALEVKPEVAAEYNRRLQAAMPNTVWAQGGCRSWYYTRDGRNTTLWPSYTWEYRLRTRRFDADAYELTPTTE